MPAVASCRHCGAILFWTREGLVHPMPGEREPIRTMLGTDWTHHARSPFDGRFHQCLGTIRQSVLRRSREPVVRRRRTA